MNENIKQNYKGQKDSESIISSMGTSSTMKWIFIKEFNLFFLLRSKDILMYSMYLLIFCNTFHHQPEMIKAKEFWTEM